MRLVRPILSALLIACLAATPAVAKTAVAGHDAPPAASKASVPPTAMSDMPDCHRMAETSGEPSRASENEQHAPEQHDCPQCDHDKSCTADMCQLKCFKVFGDLAEREGLANTQLERYVSAPLSAREPVNWKPRTPPPRS